MAKASHNASSKISDNYKCDVERLQRENDQLHSDLDRERTNNIGIYRTKPAQPLDSYKVELQVYHGIPSSPIGTFTSHH